jgi:hypothetical protein
MRFSKILLVCLGIGLLGGVSAGRLAAVHTPERSQKLSIVFDGGDPLPRPPLVADGGDPLPRPPAEADGGDPLPRPPIVADGGDPLPRPPQQSVFLDGGDPLPRPPAAFGA